MNYFKEAEQVLLQRQAIKSKLESIKNIRTYIYKNGLPRGINGIDYSQLHMKDGAAIDTTQDWLNLIEEKTKNVQAEAKLIDDVIDQLPEKSKMILLLWYVEGKTKDQIRDALRSDGSSTIYNLKNKAIGQFAVLYFGAGALDSI